VKFGLFLNTSEYAELTSHSAILESAVAYAEAAERLGFHDVWVSEHHFIQFGVCSSALTMAAYLLGRTRRLRVGTATTLVHLYHPVQLAEQVALLDQLSGGRLDFGIGRGGYLQEIEVFGVNRARHGLEVEATLDVLLDAWTKDEVSSDNPLFPFGLTRVTPRPRTALHPPLFVASLSPATIDRAAREGLPLMLWWSLDDDTRVKILAMYEEAAQRHGRDPDAVEHMIPVLALVDDDAEQARATALRNLRWSFGAGDRPHVPIRSNLRGQRDRVGEADRAVAAGAIGTTEECIQRLVETVQRTRARRLILYVEVAGDRTRTTANIERLAHAVLPEVEHRVGSALKSVAVV
jgi:alkanesulfonate monooxygenase SsuD/methylene tetrahydromethanopterin reductase-like flavin-dependent oxidoreductase (luciferase family)